NFKIKGSVDLHKTEIPNMIIQPFVENAIRHGIKHLESKKGKIDIEITVTAEYINCVVTDNGVGRAEALQNNSMAYSDHKSYGIDIVKQRLAELTKNKKANYSLDITDLYALSGKPAGTRVILQLPYKII
ncbi:MAG: ATP-binding protein, partial [Ferruginibacter sp.]